MRQETVWTSAKGDQRQRTAPMARHVIVITVLQRRSFWLFHPLHSLKHCPYSQSSMSGLQPDMTDQA